MAVDFQPIEILKPSGRLDFRELRDVAASCAASSFARRFKHPLFIGSAIYSGELGDAPSPGETAMFNFDVSDSGQLPMPESEPAGLRQAVFALIKQPPTASPPNIYFIGRASDNDLVLPDFPISRRHAQLRLQHFHYFLTDMEATNGCTLNGKRMTPKEEYEIVPGDEVGFARYRFRFVTAEQLHELLQRR